jgi:hypothetical protein
MFLIEEINTMKDFELWNAESIRRILKYVMSKKFFSIEIIKEQFPE